MLLSMQSWAHTMFDFLYLIDYTSHSYARSDFDLIISSKFKKTHFQGKWICFWDWITIDAIFIVFRYHFHRSICVELSNRSVYERLGKIVEFVIQHLPQGLPWQMINRAINLSYPAKQNLAQFLLFSCFTNTFSNFGYTDVPWIVSFSLFLSWKQNVREAW